MKRLIPALALALLAAPALAQQPPADTPAQKAAEVMYSREVQSHQADLVAAIQMQEKIATLTKQADADKKTIADLTAKNAEPTKELPIKPTPETAK